MWGLWSIVILGRLIALVHAVPNLDSYISYWFNLCCSKLWLLYFWDITVVSKFGFTIAATNIFLSNTDVLCVFPFHLDTDRLSLTFRDREWMYDRYTNNAFYCMIYISYSCVIYIMDNFTRTLRLACGRVSRRVVSDLWRCEVITNTGCYWFIMTNYTIIMGELGSLVHGLKQVVLHTVLFCSDA